MFVRTTFEHLVKGIYVRSAATASVINSSAINSLVDWIFWLLTALLLARAWAPLKCLPLLCGFGWNRPFLWWRFVGLARGMVFASVAALVSSINRFSTSSTSLHADDWASSRSCKTVSPGPEKKEETIKRLNLNYQFTL